MAGKDDKTLLQKRAEIVKQEHYAAIGQVVAEWAALESIIDMFCIKISNIPSGPGLVFMTQISGPMRKIETFEALLGLYNIAYNKKQLTHINDKIRALSEQRNRIAHDPWIFDSVSVVPTRLQATARKKFINAWIPVPTPTVIELAQKIQKLQNDMTDFGAYAIAHKHALRDKP